MVFSILSEQYFSVVR